MDRKSHGFKDLQHTPKTEHFWTVFDLILGCLESSERTEATRRRGSSLTNTAGFFSVIFVNRSFGYALEEG